MSKKVIKHRKSDSLHSDRLNFDDEAPSSKGTLSNVRTPSFLPLPTLLPFPLLSSVHFYGRLGGNLLLQPEQSSFLRERFCFF